MDIKFDMRLKELTLKPNGFHAMAELTFSLPNGDRIHHHTSVTLNRELSQSIIDQVEAALDHYFETPEGVS